MGRIQNKFGLSIVGALLLLVVAALAGVIYAGPLDPPGTPGSTQETQINSLPYTISASGAYVFTKELTGAPGSDGITILSAAKNVTLDMRGFALVGPGGSGTEDAIHGTGSPFSVRNGIVRDWGGDGVYLAGHGSIDDLTLDHVAYNAGFALYASSESIRDCHVVGSGNSGLPTVFLQYNSQITRCAFFENSGAYDLSLLNSTATEVTVVDIRLLGSLGKGIQCSGGSVANIHVSGKRSTGSTGLEASDCTASNVSVLGNGGDEISLGNGSTIEDCIVNGYGSAGRGIVAGENSVIRGCTVSNNGGDEITVGAGSVIESCSVDGWTGSANGAGNGITAGSDVTISNCTVRRNAGGGIYANVSDRLQIHDNVVTGNGSGGSGVGVQHDSMVYHNEVTGNVGTGISLFGNGNEASDNNATSNSGYGIRSNGINNEVFRNNAGNNTLGNYANDGSTSDFGPTGTVATSTSPWANITH